MASARLQKHFIRLWQSCEGLPQHTTLDNLASQLNCSRRHMRTLLSAMQQAGWITWQAEAGRGKRARLTFIHTGLELQQQRTETLLAQDNIDPLIDIVGDKNTLRQMLTTHIGRRFRAGRHILRVLYYRPLLNLLPGTALRRSETHIARQIFSGLTTINEDNGEIRADIAHHWHGLTALHWRFFIRPGIRFHHGRELDVEDIISSLSRIQTLPLFSHIAAFTSPTPWTLDIHLHEADRHLPWLLASVHAMILPKEWPTLKQFGRKPIGSGPYAVVSNNNTQLKIKSFDDYFGFRALIDEVNFWVIPESEEQSSPLYLQGMPDSEKSVESRLEEGCYYLLFDSRSPLGAAPEVREWLSHVLTPINILSRVNASHQQYWFPAYGLLPRWHHNHGVPSPVKPKGLKRLILTRHHAHTEHQLVSHVMAQLLAEHDVVLEEHQVSYNAWHQGDSVSDLWLNSVNFTLPLDYSLFALLYEVPLLQKCIPIDWQQDALAWRNQTLSLPEWCQQRVENRDMLPLIHHWLRIEGQRSMHGVKMNTLGWFDFKSAWFAPL